MHSFNLASVGVPRGHFSHIFADEAGEATAPEVLIPIKMLADERANVILSGGPKQLRPVIKSEIVKNLGLQTTYLERLMARERYIAENGCGDR